MWSCGKQTVDEEVWTDASGGGVTKLVGILSG